MKALIATFLCGAALASAHPAHAADLTIEVSDVGSGDGQVMVALFNSADTFLAKPASVARTAAVAGTTTVVLKDLPAGDYAFAVYHDANQNGKMDRNAVGMPTEDYAFSNNVLGKAGPPAYDAARITLPAAGAVTRVSLR
jgi:uncharacterized protein (DUF2141 family)